MTSPITLQSQTVSKPGRKPRHMGECEEPGKKPKKVNSEIRKQQNRIASRNYREKRKRKLQYLQRLIKDGSNDQKEVGSSPQQHETQVHSISADYERSGPISSPYILPSNSSFGSITSNSASGSDSILAASGPSFDSHLLAPTQVYPALGSNWNVTLFGSTPPVNMTTWSISPWTPNVNYIPRIPSRSEALQYTTPSGPPVFAQLHTPSQQPRDLLSDTDYYAFGSHYGSQGQTRGIPNVSLPTSSPGYQGLYPGPH